MKTSLNNAEIEINKVIIPLKSYRDELDDYRSDCPEDYQKLIEMFPNLNIEINFDNGIILNNNADHSIKLFLKIKDHFHCDFYKDSEKVGSYGPDYVCGWMPGTNYGDYLIFNIENGKVLGWNRVYDAMYLTINTETSHKYI